MKTGTIVLTLALFVSGPTGQVWAAPATPADFGVVLPNPPPSLPATVDIFIPPLLGDSMGPAVAEFTRSASPDNLVTVAGPDFLNSTVFRFYSQTTASDEIAVDRPVGIADSIATSVILPPQLHAWSTYAMWPKNGTNYGKPVLINHTDAWWLGPDRILKGEPLAIYGRNLSRGNGTATSLVYLKPLGNVAGQWITPFSVNPYRVDITVPDLSPGAYEIWVHNTHGGSFGWSGPLTLNVLAASPFAGQANNIFNVKDYGAVGDGVHDDMASVQSALDAAGNAAPAMVYFPVGTYLSNGHLFPRNSVSWKGDSRDQSIIKAGPGFPASDSEALIHSDSSDVNNVEFRNLTIDADGNLDGKSLFIFRHHKNVAILDCRLKWKSKVFDGYNGGFSFSANEYIRIENNEFIGDHVFIGNRQERVCNNLFLLTDYANSALGAWGSEEISVYNNGARDFDVNSTNEGDFGSGRFWVSQSHPDANRYLYIADNVTTDMAPKPGVKDANQGEQILFEVGSSTVAYYPTSTTADSVTFASSLPTEIQSLPVLTRDATIVKGRGTGQTRRVTAINGNTITVSPPWSVIPDSSSLIGTGPSQTHAVIYRNHLDGKSYYPTFDSASGGITMYGNVSDVVMSGNTVTDMRGGLATEFSQIPENPSPSPPSALFFNLLTDNNVTGAYEGVRIATSFLNIDHPGTTGHLGNTYRQNTFSNLTRWLAFTTENEGHTGGNLDQDVFDHNTVSNVFTGIWVGRISWSNQNTPVVTQFDNIALYRNTIDRGTATLAGSKTFDIAGHSTNLWDNSNTWTGFENSSGQPATGTALKAWRLQHFGSEANSGTGQDQNDPDHDSLPNLLEYALAGNPTAVDSDRLPSLSQNSGSGAQRLNLTFHRIADPDLTYQVWGSLDLQNWGSSPIWSSSGPENGPGLVTVSDPIQIDSQNRHFLKLKVLAP